MSNYFLLGSNNERNIVAEMVRFFESYQKSVFSFPFGIKEDDFYGPATVNALKGTDKVIVVLSTQFSTDEKALDALYLAVHLKKDIAIINTDGTKPALELKRYLKSRPVFKTLTEFGKSEGFLPDIDSDIETASDSTTESSLPAHETTENSNTKSHTPTLFDLRGAIRHLIASTNNIDDNRLIHGEFSCQGSDNISLTVDLCGNMLITILLKNESASQALLTSPSGLEKTDNGYKLAIYYVDPDEFYDADISLFENLLTAVGINDRNCWKLPAITLEEL